MRSIKPKENKHNELYIYILQHERSNLGVLSQILLVLILMKLP